MFFLFYVSATFNAIIYWIILAFVTKKWMIYLASSISFLESVHTTVLRSIITKLVPENELGKVFSILEFFKSIISMICPIVYGKLYEKTVSSVPNAFVFLTIVFLVFVLISVVVLNVSMRGRLLGIKVSKAKSKDGISKNSSAEGNFDV